MIELENRLPASLRDIDEPYEDDIICCDATLATDPPLAIRRMLPGQIPPVA